MPIQKTMHSTRPAIAALAAASLLAACGSSQTSPDVASASGESPVPRTSSGPTAPDFSLPSLDGEVVRLSEYFGESVVLINFWSTTCDPCMVEMPHLVRMYEQNKDKNFVVLAISLDGPESRAAVSSVAHDKDLPFPVLLDEETTVVARFNPKRELPFNVVIDRSGAIVHKRGGYQAGDEKSLEAEVMKALAK